MCWRSRIVGWSTRGATGSNCSSADARPGASGLAAVGRIIEQWGGRLLTDSDPATGLYLWVFEANEGARRFYARLGGREVERADSGMPSAAEEPAQRVVWPMAAALNRGG